APASASVVQLRMATFTAIESIVFRTEQGTPFFLGGIKAFLLLHELVFVILGAGGAFLEAFLGKLNELEKCRKEIRRSTARFFDLGLPEVARSGEELDHLG